PPFRYRRLTIVHAYGSPALACFCFARKGGSWARFVKRGGFGGFSYFPAHQGGGEAAPFLRRDLPMLPVQVAIRMTSRTLAKNQRFAVLTQARCRGKCMRQSLW